MRVSFWGDELERITEVDPLTGEVLADRTSVERMPRPAIHCFRCAKSIGPPGCRRRTTGRKPGVTSCVRLAFDRRPAAHSITDMRPPSIETSPAWP